MYTVPGSDKRFLQLCGVDYSAAFEAVEITHLPTRTFADCMDNCAGTAGCTGCGWGFIANDTSAEAHRCWLKSSLVSSHRASEDWCFGVLQP
jgi:hypothetical protein